MSLPYPSMRRGTMVRKRKAWYVDSSISASGNGLSWATAWKNPANIVWGSISAGDYIYLSGGSTSQSYTGSGTTTILSVGASGSAGKPITICGSSDAGHNGNVIIDGQSGGRHCVQIPQSYVTLQGLTIQNPGPGFDCIDINGGGGSLSGVIVQNNTIHVGGTNNNAHSVGIDCHGITGGSGISFRNNYIDTADSGGDSGASFTDQTDCIYISTTADDAVLVEGNTIIARNSNSNGHNDGIQLAPAGATNNGNITIRNNYIEQKYSGNNCHCMILSDVGNGKVCTVYNNVMRTAGNLAVVMICQNTNNTDTSTNGTFKLYNNTIYTVGWGISLGSPGAGSEFKNNILYVNGASAFGFVTNGWTPSTGSQIDYNDAFLSNGGTYASGTVTGWDVHKQTGDPLFTSSALYPSNNYRPTTGSAAINNGIAIPAVPVDKDGYVRPKGSAYCIGAYEF